jgi:uncharacterized membrane protein YhaH (DUF805 family)
MNVLSVVRVCHSAILVGQSTYQAALGGLLLFRTDGEEKAAAALPSSVASVLLGVWTARQRLSLFTLSVLAILDCFADNMITLRNLFRGRINRSQWLLGNAAVIAAFLVIGTIQNILLGVLGTSTLALILVAPLGLILWVGAIVIFYSLNVRRLHDFGRNGWWAITPMVLLIPFRRGFAEQNEYGNPPAKRTALSVVLNREQ